MWPTQTQTPSRRIYHMSRQAEQPEQSRAEQPELGTRVSRRIPTRINLKMVKNARDRIIRSWLSLNLACSSATPGLFIGDWPVSFPLPSPAYPPPPLDQFDLLSRPFAYFHTLLCHIVSSQPDPDPSIVARKSASLAPAASRLLHTCLHIHEFD